MTDKIRSLIMGLSSGSIPCDSAPSLLPQYFIILFLKKRAAALRTPVGMEGSGCPITSRHAARNPGTLDISRSFNSPSCLLDRSFCNVAEKFANKILMSIVDEEVRW